VLHADGTPMILPDLRTAVAVAERMDRSNRRGGGGIHCANLRFSAGWLGENDNSKNMEKESNR
jgi:hypothetical protein